MSIERVSSTSTRSKSSSVSGTYRPFSSSNARTMSSSSTCLPVSLRTLSYPIGTRSSLWTKWKRNSFDSVAENMRTGTLTSPKLIVPLLVAPVACQRLAHPDGELATARAAAGAGTIFCLSTVASASPAEIAEAAPDGVRWFQLYVFKDRGFTRELLARAAAAGFSAVLLTADTPHLGRRERDHRTGFRIPSELVPSLGGHNLLTPEETFASMADDLSWRDVERFASISGLPVLVKGVLTAEDARLACESGAAGIVVSNHGGRQLDGVPATIDVLPEVVEAVATRVPVLIDGGIRRGTDIVKALALGAQAVLAGRPFIWGLAVGGEDGVAGVFELLRAELELALALLGCRSPAEVTPAHVSRL